LVEDNASVLDIATTMLEHLGYNVLTATNGVEALEEYNKNHQNIDLVLTDITMPRMGGIELTEALQKQDPHLKVIALTGYPLEADAKEVLSEGMIDWLQKPLSITALAQAVKRSL
jgi:CheY-like chemotaxis protein